MSKQQSPRAMEAEEALFKVLNDYADVFGPSKCSIHDDGDEEPCGEGCVEVQSPAMLSEVVVVMNWIEHDTGDAIITDFSPKNSLYTHIIGLMRGALIIMERGF